MIVTNTQTNIDTSREIPDSCKVSDGVPLACLVGNTSVSKQTALKVAAMTDTILGGEDTVSHRSRPGHPAYQSPGLRLQQRIRSHMHRGRLSLSITDNRHTMISVKRKRGLRRSYQVRLHHMFLQASSQLARALALYIEKNDSAASKFLSEFIEQNGTKVKPRQWRDSGPTMSPIGQTHNLQEVFDRINDDYFGGKICARITWGPHIKRTKKRRSIRMGSYCVEDKIIRIHRSLDRPFVPGYFVEWVVFHEMLHQVHEVKVVNGRRQFHTKDFCQDEALFEYYGAAKKWEQTNIDRLLTY